MNLIRAATLTVSNLANSIELYTSYFAYSVVEQGYISAELASSWGTPNSAGRPFAIIQPSSGAEVYIRFIEQPRVDDYTALRSYGWNAIEICVQDVLAANEFVKDSPFEIIGPPNKIPGLDAIHAMQIKGPDEEIIYLTQINSDLPQYKLPRAQTLIDKLFILVMACSDLDYSAQWIQKMCGLAFGRDMEIPYTMIAKAFGTPLDELHRICTLVHGTEVFLELDQYPKPTEKRPRHAEMLVPGCAIGTLYHPDFDSLPGPWFTEPVQRDGVLYRNKRVGILQDPDGTLIEMVEG